MTSFEGLQSSSPVWGSRIHSCVCARSNPWIKMPLPIAGSLSSPSTHHLHLPSFNTLPSPISINPLLIIPPLQLITAASPESHKKRRKAKTPTKTQIAGAPREKIYNNIATLSYMIPPITPISKNLIIVSSNTRTISFLSSRTAFVYNFLFSPKPFAITLPPSFQYTLQTWPLVNVVHPYDHPIIWCPWTTTCPDHLIFLPHVLRETDIQHNGSPPKSTRFASLYWVTSKEHKVFQEWRMSSLTHFVWNIHKISCNPFYREYPTLDGSLLHHVSISILFIKDVSLLTFTPKSLSRGS